MGEKLIVGPVNKGLKTNVEPFNVDNDSFPTLINAYQWRGRVKRKRGTSRLGRLTRYFNSAISAYGSITSITSDVNSLANVLTQFGLETNGNIVPGSFSLFDVTNGNTYTDPLKDGSLQGFPAGVGIIDYASGVVTITGSSTYNAVSFLYYPNLPVMGLEDLILELNQFPGTLAFDTRYSYNIDTAFPYSIHNVSFYKNPTSSIGTSYVPKTVETPLTWNGTDYQQFWTVNYSGALWATNGIQIPFTTSNIGMQFIGSSTSPVALTVATWASANSMTFTATGNNLVVGDFVFANEFTSGTAANAAALNFQTGYVTVAGNTFTVVFPKATIISDTYKPGILQYLTNTANSSVDPIRFYDGDPTNGSSTAPVLSGVNGWVNFSPPLSEFVYSIADLPRGQYYLAGARMILPFKDRLLFFGPVVQTSSGSPIWLRDTVIYSQNGTPYYTSTFTGDPVLSNTEFFPILVPNNQTATAPAWWEDQTGFGGFATIGVDQAINSIGLNEDVIIVGLDTLQLRMVYSGNDIVPFNFFYINSEFGTSSVFSSVIMDKGVLSRGTRGYIMTSQTQCQRFDLEIPDQVYEINQISNGIERFASVRDYVNEWIYFTYPSNSVTWKFPNQTLLFNYRDNSFAIFNETYTTYGTFRRQTGETWATLTVGTWSNWNTPWNSGESTLLNPEIIAGNQQGFVVFKDSGTTGEAPSLEINNISFPAVITTTIVSSGTTVTVNAVNQYVVGQLIMFTGVSGMTQLNGLNFVVASATPTSFIITVASTAGFAPGTGGLAVPVEPVYSPNHNLNQDDYIMINGAIGTVAPSVNGLIFQVQNPTVNGFSLNPSVNPGTYLGLGTITRMYVPFIQTKQFPTAWAIGRKTRLGPQQYLLTGTNNAQITLLIYLSQNPDEPYNDGPIVPAFNVTNNSLIYDTILYTCPESTNLGLTPMNTNLQMVTAPNQEQIWHRVNTSLLGDTVQLGFTLSDTQMRFLDPITGDPVSQFAEIELHGMILDVSSSMMLS